jgi:ribonuclease P/MRP protein subunit RPP40
MKNDFFTDLAKPLYSKVILPLKAIVEGEFFDEYIKKGQFFISSLISNI